MDSSVLNVTTRKGGDSPQNWSDARNAKEKYQFSQAQLFTEQENH